MRSLVVYYSLDGNTRFIAETIAKACGADILALTLKEDSARLKGFQKFFWGGKQVATKAKPELKPFDKNPREYDLIFIGTPVWACRYSPAVETFFSTVELRNKKIALFCCHGGGKGKTLDKMKDKLTGNEIVGEIDFKEPLRTGKDASADRATAWVKENKLFGAAA